MNAVRKSKLSKISIKEVQIIKPPIETSRKTSGCNILTPPKRMKFSNPAMSPVLLNAAINANKGVHSESNRDLNTHLAASATNEDFFLKNENNCFYKCVLCSETIKSKPSYKTHVRTMHDTTINKYHIQKGFVDATKEFCTEFIQTDYNIVQSLTSIFDQIENIERIIRDHQKRSRSANATDNNKLTNTFLRDEVTVLKLYGEMIQRAFDIVSEKNELITCLQDDVNELLEHDSNLEHSKVEFRIEENTSFEEQIVKEEEEPVYELYYIEDDANQKECANWGSGTNETESTNLTPTTTMKRGRPKGELARSLEDSLTELPEATAEYIRSLTVNGDGKHQCNMCDVSAKTKMLLCVHYMRVHLKRKDKICPHCDRAFASQGDLTRHIRIHSGENPFKCDHPDCTSEFKTSGDLKKHKVVHERDRSHRPFECLECGSKFARQTDLTRHKKIHLIGKVENVGFTCELCNKIFYRKDLFRAHLNHHLKIKPFECSHCLKRFAKKYDLLKHMDKQHKSVNCDECGQHFDSRTKLIKHFSTGMCEVMKSGAMKMS